MAAPTALSACAASVTARRARPRAPNTVACTTTAGRKPSAANATAPTAAVVGVPIGTSPTSRPP